MAKMNLETGMKRFFTLLGGVTAVFVFLWALFSMTPNDRPELIGWLLLLLIMGVCVLAGWLLGIAVAWVIRGFRGSD